MPRNRILLVLAILCGMVVIGTTSYRLIEGWSFLDSLYMTVIVLTTIGFQEVHPLSHGGKIFTICFSLVGYFLLAGSITLIITSIIESDYLQIRRRKRMFDKISRLRDHIIVCGAGKVGGHVTDSLVKAHKPFVLIDSDPSVFERIAVREHIESRRLLSIAGDATKEEVLLQAGIVRAKGIITCVRNDAVNLFIALTAKKLNPSIRISSYVMDEVNISKFYHVGASDVISGDSVIGKRLGDSMLNSNVAAFIEQTNMLGENDSFIVGDVTLKERSPHVNHTIREADIFRKAGLLIFALRKKGSQKFSFNPDAATLLQAGDTLITFGSESDIARLERYING